MRTIQRLAMAAFFAALALGGAAQSQSMSPQLKEPAAVPLDFLALIGKDADWLRAQITALGATGAARIGGDILETADRDVLKAANRIRAFAYLASKGIRPPYYDLPLDTGSGTARCVTQFPRSIVPGIGPMDFAVPAFPAGEADAALLRACTVGAAGDYAAMGREAFRQRYFGASGTLKPEFRDLGDDAAFKAKAIDEGFFLATEDFSGKLQLDLR